MVNINSETLDKRNGDSYDYKKTIPNREDRFENMSHNAGKKIGSMASNIANSSNEYVKAIGEYVQENPAKSVAIATAVGVVAGSIITMVMGRRP